LRGDTPVRRMINYIVESFAVVIINLQQEIRKQADTQIVDAKQLEVKVNLFKHYRQLLMAHSKQFHNVGVQKSIEKSYFFEEKILLALVKDMQHFLDNHCFDIFLSSSSVVYTLPKAP